MSSSFVETEYSPFSRPNGRYPHSLSAWQELLQVPSGTLKPGELLIPAISERKLERAISWLAEKITSLQRTHNQRLIVLYNKYGAVSIGEKLAIMLKDNPDISFHAIHVTSATGYQTFDEPQLKEWPNVDLTNAIVFIVEDIGDSGNSLDICTQVAMQSGVEPENLLTFNLLEKDRPQFSKAHHPDLAGLKVRDTFLVGGSTLDSGTDDKKREATLRQLRNVFHVVTIPFLRTLLAFFSSTTNQGVTR
ncbi:MAG TPA: hypothetical protein VF209_04545 [Patescibacteria group bacterium]